MGFARGLHSGVSLGNNLFSIYNYGKKNREERELKEDLARVGTAKPTERIEHIMPPGDQVEGSGGQVPTQAKRFDFLGETFETMPDATKQARARQLEIANVLERRGLVERGAALRQAVMAQDATAEDRQHQRALRPLQIAAAQRADRTGARAEADDEVLRGVSADVGKWLEQRLTGPDGTKRSVTPDDHVQATLYRAGALQLAGKTEQAAQAAKEYQAAAFGKIQMETAQRTEAARVAAAGVRAGRFDAFQQFFDTYIPDGSKVVSITPRKDGKIEIIRESGGKQLRPEVLTQEDMLVGIESAVDPTKAWQMTMQLADLAFRERSERRADRADGRAAAADGRAAAADGRAAEVHAAGARWRAVSGLMAQHQQALLDPNAPPDARQAAATALQGYQQATSAPGKAAPYKVEAGDVTTLLGVPATDRNGRPIMDPMTGRQLINRNQQREQEFFAWMRDQGITDTNQALALYPPLQGRGAGAAQVPPQQQRVVGQVYQTPKGPMIWRGNGWEPAPGR